MAESVATYTPVPELPDGASWLTRFIYGVKALLILKDEMGNPEAGALINRCFDHEVYAVVVERMKATEEGRRLLAERPSMSDEHLDLDALSALPEGTLGHAFATYYADQGFPPFDTTEPVDTDVQYVSKRYRETHDLMHVLTGYTTDNLGEMELQAFMRGTIGIRSALLILVFGYGVNVWDRAVFLPTTYYRLLKRARVRGERADLFLAFPFEEHWETPLAEVRRAVLGEEPCA